jgi:tetratricopeptide (TPR) repeat protein
MMQAMRAWYLTQIATIALLFKQRDVALAYYNKILLEQPTHALTMSRVAFLHHEAGNRARAIADFERVVAVNPNDANSWFNLGYLRQEACDHPAAIEAFDRAVSQNDTHDRAWYGKALSLIALGQVAEAIAPLKKNVTLQPMSPFGHIELARVYFKLGDLERCEKRMRRLKTFDPKNAAVLEDETGIRVGIDRWWVK